MLLSSVIYLKFKSNSNITYQGLKEKEKFFWLWDVGIMFYAESLFGWERLNKLIV